MTLQRYSTGSPLEKYAGYSRAVADGDWIFVAGTTGFNYTTMEMPEDVGEQTEQTFQTIKDALAHFDSSLDDVVRVRVFIVDVEDWSVINGIVGKHFKDVLPANTTVVSNLVDPRMKVEIEVTAHRRQK